MSASPIAFSEHGPFDDDERRVVVAVLAAVEASSSADAAELCATVERHVGLLDRLGELLAAYPSLYREQSLGHSRRDLSSLVDRLSRGSPSSLPRRSAISSTKPSITSAPLSSSPRK